MSVDSSDSSDPSDPSNSSIPSCSSYHPGSDVTLHECDTSDNKNIVGAPTMHNKNNIFKNLNKHANKGECDKGKEKEKEKIKNVLIVTGAAIVLAGCAGHIIVTTTGYIVYYTGVGIFNSLSYIGSCIF